MKISIISFRRRRLAIGEHGSIFPYCKPLFCPKIEGEIEQGQIHGYRRFLQYTINSEIPFYCSNHRIPTIERDFRAKRQQLYVKLLFLKKGAINNLVKALFHKLQNSLLIFSQKVRHFSGWDLLTGQIRN